MKKTEFFVQSGIIAALYFLLTVLIYPLSYGEVQIRFSEALMILAVFTPASIPGLTIGCFFANLMGPYSFIDALFGGTATLLSCILIWFTRKIKFKKIPLLSLIFPVIINAVVIGAEINLFFLNKDASFSLTSFLLSGLWIGAGEFLSCCLLGVPLYFAVSKINIFSYDNRRNE